MARGKEAKLRRRNRKQEDERVNVDVFGDDAGNAEGEHDFDLPMPPGMSGAKVEDASSEEEEEEVVVKKKKKKSKKKSSGGDASMSMPPPKKKSEIKRTPLILLILMTGSTLLPALIFANPAMRDSRATRLRVCASSGASPTQMVMQLSP